MDGSVSFLNNSNVSYMNLNLFYIVLICRLPDLNGLNLNRITSLYSCTTDFSNLRTFFFSLYSNIIFHWISLKALFSDMILYSFFVLNRFSVKIHSNHTIAPINIRMKTNTWNEKYIKNYENVCNVKMNDNSLLKNTVKYIRTFGYF